MYVQLIEGSTHAFCACIQKILYLNRVAVGRDLRVELPVLPVPNELIGDVIGAARRGPL